jgi:protein-tyrosine phosphatase
MVCLGNICRSPLAEGVMRQLIKEQGLDWSVASAGTGSWHVGKAPDHRSIAVAKTFGYDISTQRAQHFNVNFFESFDYMLVMDRNNYHDVMAQARNEEERKKVKFFLAEEQEVTDPYYDHQLFNPVFKQIESRCKQLIEEMATYS